MKKIASSVYENLTQRQRVIAAIEAEARGDGDERQRLISSCPKVTYRQTNIEFSETMENLMVLALAVECDLRGYALSFVIAIRVDAENALKLLTPYANIRAAWESTISQMGIDAESMRKAGPPPSPMLEFIEDFIPDPDRKEAEELATEMMEMISAV